MDEETKKLENLKINESDLSDISSLSNRPNEATEYGGNSLSAKELKERFDNIPKQAIEGLNKLIDFMQNNDYSSEIKIDRTDFKTLSSLVANISTGTLAKTLVVAFDRGDPEYANNVLEQTLTARIKYLLAGISTINNKTIPELEDSLEGFASGVANAAETRCKEYTAGEISNLIDSATDDYNTLGKIESKVKASQKELDERIISVGNYTSDIVSDVIPTEINNALVQEAVLRNPESGAQTINGDVQINGRLRVDGDQTIVEAESLLVKDRFIVCNFGDFSQGQDGKPETAGIVMLTGGRDTRDYYYHFFNAYGIIHDQSTDTVRLGRGVLRCDNSDLVDGYPEKMENPIFFFGRAEYKEGSMIVIPEEGQAISTRANTIQNGNIPEWDDEQKMFVDSGVSLGDIDKALDELHNYAQALK